MKGPAKTPRSRLHAALRGKPHRKQKRVIAFREKPDDVKVVTDVQFSILDYITKHPRRTTYQITVDLRKDLTVVLNSLKFMKKKGFLVVENKEWRSV